jgi:hypothetical protein
MIKKTYWGLEEEEYIVIGPTEPVLGNVVLAGFHKETSALFSSVREASVHQGSHLYKTTGKILLYVFVR